MKVRELIQMLEGLNRPDGEICFDRVEMREGVAFRGPQKFLSHDPFILEGAKITKHRNGNVTITEND